MYMFCWTWKDFEDNINLSAVKVFSIAKTATVIKIRLPSSGTIYDKDDVSYTKTQINIDVIQ